MPLIRFLLAGILCVVLACLVHARGAEGLRFNVSGFTIEGELPISREAAQAVLAPYVGPSVTIEQLQDAATALEEELSSRGHAFYGVALPAQALEGVVTLRVLKFGLTRINVSGNNHFSTQNVLASLPSLRKGESPNVAEVARNRAAANEHASKEIEITFRQSDVPDSVDADVTVKDQAPQSIFIGLNNIGERRTGRWRATLGYQHSNLWDRDHTVTASYTTAPENVRDVGQYGLYYRVPFYAVSGALTLFYAYSDVNSGTIAGAFEVSGRGTFTGAHWKQILTPAGAYSHALEIGVDDRFFDNNVMFGSTQLGVDVRSRPVSLAYQARFDETRSTIGASVQYARNLGGGSDNTDAAYLGNRAGASRDWQAWRYGLDGQWLVSPWTLSARLRGQYAGEALVPGEQFGIGGAASVRGLREREATGDYGISFTVEALAPLPWEGVSALVFVDTGDVRIKNALAGQQARQHATTAGVGLRWTIARRFSLALDAAQVLESTTPSDAGDRRIHVTLVYRF